LRCFLFFFGTLVVIKIFPRILFLNPWLSLPGAIICAVKPIYVFWFKDEFPENAHTEKGIGWTRRTRKFILFDEKMAQGSLALFVVTLAKYYPEVFSMSLWLSIPLTIICAYYPLWVFWVKDEPNK